MIRSWRILWLLLFDVVGLFALLNVGSWVESDFDQLSLMITTSMGTIILIVVFFFYAFDLYSLGTEVFKSRIEIRILVASLFAISVILGGAYTRISEVLLSPITFAVLFLSLGLSAAVRLIILKRLRLAFSRYRILLIGDRHCWDMFRRDVGQSPDLCYASTEFMELFSEELESFNSATFLTSMEEVISECWSHIVYATRRPLAPRIVEALATKKLDGTRIYSLDEFSERYWRKVSLQCGQESWLLGSTKLGVIQGHRSRYVKEWFDKVITIVLLILSAPISLLAIIGILLESGRPIFFAQTRVGLNGTEFTMYKFRSMRVRSERGSHQWTARGDDRITRIGRFMRRFRLDELPQLINVLRGEMSLVGPRPELPSITAELTRRIPFYRLRLLALPGLTGWAQVAIPYAVSVEDSEDKIQYDLYYIKKSSLLLDIEIVCKTLRIVTIGYGI